MSRLADLKNAKSLKNLAPLLGFTPKTLAYVLYKIPEEIRYKEFSIPKKMGGERVIKAPQPQLKILQRNLADLIQDCIEEIEGEKGYKKQLSHGFKRGFSIVTNATKHRNKRFVFNADLADFFPSINFGRVRGYFIKNNKFLLDEKISTILAQIACHENSLPQGSPCSPIISDLVAQVLDSYMVGLAKEQKCTYSRYVDDITFSSNSKSFPAAVAFETKSTSIPKKWCGLGDCSIWVPGKDFVNQIQRAGFQLNPQKTRMQFADSRQTTTGLVVNKKVNVKIEYYRTVRSQCHALFNKGSFYRKSIVEGEEIRESGTLKQLEGALSFIFHVKKPKAPLRQKFKDKNGKPLTKAAIYEHGPNYERKETFKVGRKPERGLLKLYRNFLFYKYLYGLSRPLIMCEGKTDNVYLSCALNQLVDKFPVLTHRDTHPKTKQPIVVHDLQIFRNHGAVREVWNHAAGASFLATLIRRFKEFIQPFKAPGFKFPIIIVVDNDDGPRKKGGVYHAIQSHGHKDVDGTLPYYHVLENVYVVPLPQVIKGVDIDFEDLFDKATWKRKHGKKIFKKFPEDLTKEFGKSVFADHVIRPNQAKINFSAFEPLFTILSEIISNYKPPAAKQFKRKPDRIIKSSQVGPHVL